MVQWLSTSKTGKNEPDEVVSELSGDVGVGVRDEFDPLVQRRILGWGRRTGALDD